MLTLGWSDGYSFIPADFAMMSSARKSNRVQEISYVFMDTWFTHEPMIRSILDEGLDVTGLNVILSI